MKKIFFLLMISIWIAGCNGTPKNFEYVNLAPHEDTAPELKDYYYQGAALQAHYRLVLSTKKNNDKPPVICAEPFPEGASEAEYFRKFFSELDGRKTGSERRDKYNVTLPHPTHAVVKFYRDAVFALCQAAMNNWVGTENKGAHCKKTTEGKGAKNTKGGNASSPFFTKTITTEKDGKTITTEKETIACNEFEAQLFNLQDIALEMMRAGSREAAAREAEAKLELEKLKRDKNVPNKE